MKTLTYLSSTCDRSLVAALSCGLALVGMAPALGQGRDTLDPTKTRYALPLPEPPVIDGVIDVDGESWNLAGGAAGTHWQIQYDADLEDLYRGGGPVEGGPSDPPWDATDLGCTIFAGYDEDNLYIAVRVVDDWPLNDDAAEGSENQSTWLDDSVEIFIDGDNSNYPERDTTGTNPEVVDTGGQFVITANNAYRQAEAGNPGYGEDAAWYALTALSFDGYEAEFRISWDTLGNPEPGDIIGFTVAVNDDDGIVPGGVSRQILWVGETHVEASYGNLVIGGKTYSAPRAPAPTMDGVVNEGEYPGAEEMILDRTTGSYVIGVGDDEWPEDDHSVSAWITHDDDAVFVGVIVMDDLLVNDSAEPGSEDGNTWLDDSIEILLDPDDSNDQGRGGQNYEGQYVLTANGAWRDNEANNPTYGPDADWYALTTETDEGYQLEFKITKAALLNPEDGAVMGFCLALNDDDGVSGGDRKLQLNWSGYPHQEYTYGFLELAETAEDIVMTISLTGDEQDRILIEWNGSGTLKKAGEVTGPYEAVADATSPYEVPTEEAQAYYTVEK